MAGCAWGIVCWLEGERRRLAMMEECIRLFAQWDFALRSGHIRLYQFLEQYESGQPEFEKALAEVSRLLRQNCYSSGREVWLCVMGERRKKLSLSGEAYEIFLKAGDAFFCGSSGESLHTMASCRERMEACLTKARGELAGKRRVYIPMGMLGGVVLIILLV
jgi:hypothetical protein